MHESRDDGIATSLVYPLGLVVRMLGLKMIMIGIRFFAFILATREKKKGNQGDNPILTLLNQVNMGYHNISWNIDHGNQMWGIDDNQSTVI